MKHEKQKCLRFNKDEQINNNNTIILTKNKIFNSKMSNINF